MPVFASTPQPRSSPWGTPQSAEQLIAGVWSVQTASHGGFLLSADRQAAMPASLRLERPIYEEDCDWALVVLAFEAEFAAAGTVPVTWPDHAHNIVKGWHPDAYTAFTGVVLTAADSHVLREREAYRERLGQVIVRSAFGSWAEWVPAGHTGLVGYRLADLDDRAQPRFADEAQFALCDAATYRALRHPVSFADVAAEPCARPAGL